MPKKTKRKRKKPAGSNGFAVLSCRVRTRNRWQKIAKADKRSPDAVLSLVAERIEKVGLDAVLGKGGG